MSAVVDFPGITTLNHDPARMLEAAQSAGLVEVVICGVDAIAAALGWGKQ